MTQNIDLNLLKVFWHVASAGSFSQAALQTKQPKSRVSRNITALEKALGVQLIYRTTRQFQLTQAGSELFERSAPLLKEISNAIGTITSQAHEVAGPIKISVPEDMGTELFGKICAEFLRSFPKVRIDLQASNRYVDLVKESVDIAVRIGGLKDSSMLQKKLGSVSVAIVVSPVFKKRHDLGAKVDVLAELPYLGFSLLENDGARIKLTNGKESKKLKLQPIFRANNFFSLRSMALEGAGFAILPTFLVKEHIQRGELIHVYKEWVSEKAPVSLLIPNQSDVPQRVKQFMAFVAERLTVHL